MIHFTLDTEYIELVKLLKITNLVSTGGEAKMVVISGEVLYNGTPDTRKRLKVRKGDKIEYNGETIVVE